MKPKESTLTDYYIQLGQATYKQYRLEMMDFVNYSAYMNAFDRFEAEIQSLLDAIKKLKGAF